MWNGVGPHVLVVEQLTSNSASPRTPGALHGVWGIHSGGWTRVPALLVNGALQLQLQWPATVTYRTEPDGTLSATYEMARGEVLRQHAPHG